MARFNPFPAPVTGPVIHLTVETTDPIGQRFQVGLDYMAIAPLAVTQAVMIAFLAAWRFAYEATWKATLAADTSITRYICAETSAGVTPSVVTLANVVGTGGTVSLPGFVASVVTKYSTLKGQRGRGRMYMGGVPTAFTTPATDPNLINAAGIAAYLALTAPLLVGVVAGGTTWNLSITTRPVPPAVLVATGVPVNILQLQQPLGTVRRRREGRGI